jgi:N-methylhydantoinase A
LLSIAVDIGGTFTDVVAADDETGRYYTAKVATTAPHPVDAVLEGARRVLIEAGSGPERVARFIHGTTVGTNAVLEGKGAITAVLATNGFEDVLEIGRMRRTSMYDLMMDAETPAFLAPKRRRRGIVERVAADGSVLVKLDEDQARAAIRELVDQQGAEAFAVCLLFSFRHPEHERRLRELIEEVDPKLGVSLSCEVDPMYREYERTVVTVFDAYVRPAIGRYVDDLADELRAIELNCPIHIMQSRGGITSAEIVSRRPVSILLSGPAAGVIAAKRVAEQSGLEDVITIDIGGTSADISLVAAGKTLISTEGRIGRYPLRLPMVDVNTIGAGGGSVAWGDAAGGFHVGPRSAGADPGPVCYGRGGSEPTVTDASLALGYLDPDYFAGGTMSLDRAAAIAALERLGSQLGLNAIETAAGIHRIVNAKMATEIRVVSVRRGYDPRRFALVTLGGAGPLHGGRLAAELGIPTVVVPAVPGVLSALGLLVANVEHDAVETVALPTPDAQPADLERIFSVLQERVTKWMRIDNVPDGAALTTRFADMRYVGQGYSLEVPVPPSLGADSLRDVEDAFHAAHSQVYGHAHPDAETEFVNLRLVQSWALPRSRLSTNMPMRKVNGSNRRLAYFEEFGHHVETPVYERGALDPGQEITGPAIVEQPDTTLVLYPGQRAVVEAGNTLTVSVPARGRQQARLTVVGR